MRLSANPRSSMTQRFSSASRASLAAGWLILEDPRNRKCGKRKYTDYNAHADMTPRSRPTLRNALTLRTAAFVSCLVAAVIARAGDMCPAPPHHTPRSAAEIAADDHLIHIESDSAAVAVDDTAILNGHVTLKQDERSAGADSVTYNELTGRITVAGHVSFEDPLVRLSSEAGSYEQRGGGEFDRAEFELLDRRGRGSAGEIGIEPGGKISLAQVRYTTCPVGNQDWMLQASSINLDTVKQVGVARHAWMQFKGMPVLYTPYLSFPLGDERKSGFLIPVLDHSGTNGYEIGVAYYFNLAPNYDLTLTPEILSSRGVELGSEFRLKVLAGQDHRGRSRVRAGGHAFQWHRSESGGGIARSNRDRAAGRRAGFGEGNQDRRSRAGRCRVPDSLDAAGKPRKRSTISRGSDPPPSVMGYYA